LRRPGRKKRERRAAEEAKCGGHLKKPEQPRKPGRPKEKNRRESREENRKAEGVAKRAEETAEAILARKKES
jgi:hypothetical protein